MHRVVAQRLAADPTAWADARRRVRRWAEEGRPYAARWAALIDGDPTQLYAAMVDPAEWARALRQSTPFAGVLDARARWAIHAEVRRRLESIG